MRDDWGLERMYQVILEFAEGSDTAPVDTGMLTDLVMRLPGAPHGDRGVRDVPSGDLVTARAVGAMLFLVCGDEIARRAAAG